MKLPPSWLPMPPEIDSAPEAAILAALATTLEIAEYALIAEYPELCDQEPAYRRTTPGSPAAIASSILVQTGRLTRLLQRYRAALVRAALAQQKASGGSGPDDSIPF